MPAPTTDSPSPTTSLSATPHPDNRTVCSTTASDATTPTAFITEAAFLALLHEVNQRLSRVEETNSVLVHEIDELIADVEELRAT
jgi:hypothetical protein